MIEQRNETRLVEIEAKIDRILDRVESSIDASKEAKKAAEGAKRSASNTKWTVTSLTLTTRLSAPT